MYARMQTGQPIAQPADPPDLQRLVDAVAGQPGCVGVYGLRPIDSSGCSLITLWATEDDAWRSVGRHRENLDPWWDELTSDLIYEVRTGGGRSGHRTPTSAGESHRCGPASPAHLLGFLH